MKRKIFLSTNIVGGLGNQLFLLANLHATSLRLKQQQEQLDVVAHVERLPSSSSCHEPRPTYWHTPLMSLTNEAFRDTAAVALPAAAAAGAATVVPELGSDAAPYTFSDLSKIAQQQQPEQQSSATSPMSFNFVGFFQSDRYFSDLRDQVVDTLCPPHLGKIASTRLSHDFLGVSEGKQQEKQHTVGLHVRRGDYLLLRETFEILSHEYYFQTMEQLFGRQLFRSPHSHRDGAKRPLKVLVFGEDATFCRVLSGALSTKYSAVEAQHVTAESLMPRQHEHHPAEDWTALPQDAKEMLLMAACDDVVAANSSFSWWAGYFAQTAAPSGYCRVVAPQKWFVGKELPEMTHLYPSEWIVV